MNSQPMRRMHTEEEIQNIPFKTFSHVLTEEDIEAESYIFDRRDIDGKHYISSLYVLITVQIQNPEESQPSTVTALLCLGGINMRSGESTQYINTCVFGGMGTLKPGEIQAGRAEFELITDDFSAGDVVSITFMETSAYCLPMEI